MPIRSDLRGLYPSDWEAISHFVRFVREAGRCQQCLRRHGEIVHRLPDGRWFDRACNAWRDSQGQPCPWPDMFEYQTVRDSKVILAAAHIVHDPRKNGDATYDLVAAWCQRCHLMHDRPYHIVRRQITRAARGAFGDLFFGDYTSPAFILVPDGYAAIRSR